MDAVNPICDVNHSQVSWPKARVRLHQFGEDALEGLSKLHGLGRGKACSFVVNKGIGEVHDEPQKTVALRDYAQWRQAKQGARAAAQPRVGVLSRILAGKTPTFPDTQIPPHPWPTDGTPLCCSPDSLGSSGACM